jgi:hypothetical protein
MGTGRSLQLRLKKQSQSLFIYCWKSWRNDEIKKEGHFWILFHHNKNTTNITRCLSLSTKEAQSRWTPCD